VAAAALAGLPVDLPAPVRNAAFVLLGVSMGTSVTPETLEQLRASLIGATRDEVRPAERVTSLVLGFVTAILPRRWRINLARKVAQVLADAFVAARPGRPIVASAEGEQPHINPTASPRQRACHPA
jgi:hypothetical protein